MGRHGAAKVDATKPQPNEFTELPVQFAKRIREVIRGLSTLVGFDGLVVGWKVGYDLPGLSLAFPAIYVVDLATNYVLHRCLRQVCGAAAANLRDGGAPPAPADHLRLD